MIQRLKLLHLLSIIGLASFVTLVVPALAISPGETVEFDVSADPDIYDHANAHATLYYYQSGSDQYVRVDVNWGKASIGGALMYFEIGKEFAIIETNHPNPEHHITVAWHPWWTGELPIYGEGSRIMDSSGPGIYLASYYFIAKRVDYSSNEVWAELMVSVTGEMGSFDIDYDWQSLSLQATLSISASSGGTTDPAPGTYTYDYGSSVTVLATANLWYTFKYWSLDGTTVYGNPITVTMDSDHTLKAYFRCGCPILSVWNGTDYACEGLLDIHNPEGIDVIYEHTLVTTPQRENGAYLLQLTEHPQTHSYIDQVKLYAIFEDRTMKELPLIWAWHSEDGNVLPQLLHSDDWKADTLGTDLNNGTSQRIDLKFASLSPNLEIIGFAFEIEGNNRIIKR